MKKLISMVLASLALSLAGFSQAQAKTAVKTEFQQSIGSGFWVSAYSGYDFANLGKMAADLKAFANDPTLVSSGDVGVTGTDNSGILVGGQFGLDLDRSNSLSLGLEHTWTSQLSSGFSSGPDLGFYEKMDPTLLGITLNYGLVLLNEGGSKTSLTLGGGYYRGSVHYNSNAETGHTIIGDFGGDALGGTVGLSQEMALAPGFFLEADAKFRAADFGKLQSTNVTNDGVAQSGSQQLVTFPSQFHEINVRNSSASVASGNYLTDLDYTGFNGNLGFKLVF